MLFALPFLLSAQNVTVNTGKESSFVKQMIKGKQAENSVYLYSGTGNNLPDSIYTYEGEEKELYSKAAFTYDDAGRVLQEKGEEYLNYGDDSGLEYKIDYIYTQEGDNIKTEEIKSIFVDDEWVYFSKLVTVYNSGDMRFPLGYDYFFYDEDHWNLDFKFVSIEFDESNRPIVSMDSVFEKSYISGDIDTAVLRVELSYKELGQDILLTTFHKNKLVFNEIDEWIPLQQVEFTFNEDNKMLKQVSYDYTDEVEGVDWIYNYTTDFEYDEKRNLISEVYSSSHGSTGVTYYKNIYSTTDANDVIFAVKSKIYPNPASDILYVSIEDIDNAVLTLVNATGGVVIQKAASGSVTEIPVQSLSKGNYFLIIKTGQGIKTHKVIIK